MCALIDHPIIMPLKNATSPQVLPQRQCGEKAMLSNTAYPDNECEACQKICDLDETCTGSEFKQSTSRCWTWNIYGYQFMTPDNLPKYCKFACAMDKACSLSYTKLGQCYHEIECPCDTYTFQGITDALTCQESCSKSDTCLWPEFDGEICKHATKCKTTTVATTTSTTTVDECAPEVQEEIKTYAECKEACKEDPACVSAKFYNYHCHFSYCGEKESEESESDLVFDEKKVIGRIKDLLEKYQDNGVALKQGLKCNYEPSFCFDHGAIAFAVFPANDKGFCDKQPLLEAEFCQTEGEEETLCPYCVFGSADNPEYFAALPEEGMKCKIICDGVKGPRCSCMNPLLRKILFS